MTKCLWCVEICFDVLFTLNCRNGIMSCGPVGTKPGSRTRLRSTIWGPMLYYITCCKLNLSPVCWLVMEDNNAQLLSSLSLTRECNESLALESASQQTVQNGLCLVFLKPWKERNQLSQWCPWTHVLYAQDLHTQEGERNVFWCIEISSHIWPFKNWDQ